LHQIQSPSGASIACWSSGSGPPVLLVHGTTSDRTNWSLVEGPLAERFAVFTMNRIGRAGSSEQPASYRLEAEFDDVSAVVDWIGEPVHVVGHSAGGLCALGASQQSTRFRSLTLYEPPPGGGDLDLASIFREQLATTPNEAVVRLFLGGVGETEDELERLAETPAWESIVRLAPTIPAELAAIRGYRFDASAFAGLDAPLMLMAGAEGNPLFRVVLDTLAEVNPEARRRELAGQRHMAPLLAPRIFVQELGAFLAQV
jgi:pimeloyl-ACP methyl ester carboxylesterase